jgi:hypothetical protein
MLVAAMLVAANQDQAVILTAIVAVI